MFLRIRTDGTPTQLVSALRITNEFTDIGLKAFFIKQRVQFKSGRRRLSMSPGDILFEDPDWDDKRALKRATESAGLGVEEVTVAEMNQPPLRHPTIGLYAGFGVTSCSLRNTTEALASLGYLRVAFMNSGSISAALQSIDVLVVPDGDFTLITEGLGMTGADSVRRFVENGGTFVGIAGGSLVALSASGRAAVPRSESYTKPASLLSFVEGQVISDFEQTPGYAFWNYSLLDGVIRLLPVEGPVTLKARRTPPSFFLGCKEVRTWLCSPLFSVENRKTEMAKIKAISNTASLGAEYKLVKDLATKASMVVQAPYSMGELFLFSPEVSHPDLSDARVWLGGAILVGCDKDLGGSSPTPRQAMGGAATRFYLADLLAKSYDLERQTEKLTRLLEIIVPLTLGKFGTSIDEKMLDVVKALDGLSPIFDDLRKNVTTTIKQEHASKGELERLNRYLGLSPAHKARTDFIGQSLMRAMGINSELFENSSRGVMALFTFSVNLEKELLELSKALLKSSEEVSVKGFRDVLFGLSGDGPLYAPWYDGRDDRPETNISGPKNFGLIPPLLSIVIGYKRSSTILRSIQLFISS